MNLEEMNEQLARLTNECPAGCRVEPGIDPATNQHRVVAIPMWSNNRFHLNTTRECDVFVETIYFCASVWT